MQLVLRFIKHNYRRQHSFPTRDTIARRDQGTLYKLTKIATSPWVSFQHFLDLMMLLDVGGVNLELITDQWTYPPQDIQEPVSINIGYKRVRCDGPSTPHRTRKQRVHLRHELLYALDVLFFKWECGIGLYLVWKVRWCSITGSTFAAQDVGSSIYCDAIITTIASVRGRRSSTSRYHLNINLLMGTSVMAIT